jgi:hypothetical protein
LAFTFDGSSKRIILDTASTSASYIWSRWVDWLDSDTNNARWPVAMRQAGGDDLGGGLSIPPYIFLLNGWRVRPMESNHSLVITGNLFVEGGGVPVVQTVGAYNVSVQYTVPVQAQGIATGGSSFTLAQIAEAVRIEMDTNSTQLAAIVSALSAQAIDITTLRKIGKNRMVTDRVAGTLTIYDDDDTTPLLTAPLWENAAGTQAYRGQGADRRDRLT